METKQELDVKAIQERLEKVGTMYYEDVHFLQESIPALLSALSDAEGIVRDCIELMRDEWMALEFQPSCQKGLVERCRCKACHKARREELFSRPEVQSILLRGGKQ